MPRPQADRFVGKKNLFLVPNFVASPGTPQEGKDLIARYWSEVRDSISNLERSLGTVAKVYHEMVCDDGDAGIRHVELMNPDACTLISAICQSTGEIRSLEDVELVAEHTDWQRVLSIGPASHKVLTAALEGFQTTLATRYERIAERISDDLADGETAVLFIREDHRVQFPADIQVFFVAPPSLDALKRWLEEFFRPSSGDVPNE